MVSAKFYFFRPRCLGPGGGFYVEAEFCGRVVRLGGSRRWKIRGFCRKHKEQRRGYRLPKTTAASPPKANGGMF